MGLRQQGACRRSIARDPNIDASGPSAPYGIPAACFFTSRGDACGRPTTGISTIKGMDMQCSCGADTVNTEHLVKTLEKAQEWMRSPEIGNLDMPLTIDRDICKGCGRQRVRIWDAQRKLIESRG